MEEWVSWNCKTIHQEQVVNSLLNSFYIYCTITFKNRFFESNFQQNTPVHPCNLIIVRGKSMGESLIAKVNSNMYLLVFVCFAECTGEVK